MQLKSKFLITMLVLCFSASFGAESLVMVTPMLSHEKANAGDFFMIKIKIERKNLDSFFLLEQEIPEGMEAFGIESSGAEFSYENGKVKYTWLRLPNQDEIQVMFKVKISKLLKGRIEFPGRYYYIMNEEKQEFQLPKVGIDVQEYVDPAQTEAVFSYENAGISVKEKELNNSPDDIEFKVQLLSSQISMNKDSLGRAYGVKDLVHEEFTNGVHKYIVGSFKTFNQAKAYKNKLKDQKFTPYIIALNRGKKIPVNEAIEIMDKMLSEQKK